MSTLERIFKLNEHKTDVKTEVIAGITTFMTMGYILAVNPGILSATGMDPGGVFTATALSAVIATLIMAFYANYPFALAPGMGLNAFFAFSVVLGMGHSWEFALTAVFLEGLIFILLSFVNAREAIVNAIPMNLKNAVSVGIGLFIAFIGLQGAGIIVNDDAVLVALGDLTQPTAIVAILGIIITGILLYKKVKGAILIGILVSTVISIPLGVTQFNGFVSLPPSLAPVAFKLRFSAAEIFSLDMLVVLFTFLFVDVFDTIGTLIGVASKADMLDKDGNLPRVKPALFADAVGTSVGALLGTSTVTTYVESAAGVAEGGRTGLTALTTSVLFALALFFAPIFGIIPGAATAPALIIVGLFMMSPIMKINLDDFTEAIPAFLTIIMMPLAYSIAEGIVFGMVSYTLLKTLTGKYKDVSIVMYILSILFVLKYIFL
ncbi:putative MFS transporter, AGZA family, xanthine/uracil permease [Proteiniborus ethanoligenes]|uniref:Putative MFS transporter, AGZA family, xanthine/uracil permease n=1 Tax=Proteiniborus ethanoligenes TaxID=415015 RepID=A0A1H3NH61_9FIRM|nr:NCS2 family permease [Proteiniborus ethanoligenes]SDY88222.1 putative MFS transporter, AGZA family, xanthine/uracil permease [Proteiniborus ethanoligenes]